MSNLKDIVEQIIIDAVDAIMDGSNDTIQDISEVDKIITGMNKQFGTNYILSSTDRKDIIDTIHKEWG